MIRVCHSEDLRFGPEVFAILTTFNSATKLFATTDPRHRIHAETNTLFGFDLPLITPERWINDFQELGIKEEAVPLTMRTPRCGWRAVRFSL